MLESDEVVLVQVNAIFLLGIIVGHIGTVVVWWIMKLILRRMKSAVDTAA